MNKPLTVQRRRSAFSGANAEYIDELYEAFCESPELVSPEWRNFFYGFEQGAGDVQADQPLLSLQAPTSFSGVERLFMAYRHLGHLYAEIDPLGLQVRTQCPVSFAQIQARHPLRPGPRAVHRNTAGAKRDRDGGR